MSVEDALEARNNLYGIFDRGIEIQQFGTAKDPKENAEEVLEDLAMDDYIKKVSIQENPSTPKLQKVFALVEAMSELSEQGEPKDNSFIATYLELRRRYFDKKSIPDDLLKSREFLDIFRKKLSRYQNQV